MSFIEKVAAAVMPAESDEDRVVVRSIAEALAGDGESYAGGVRVAATNRIPPHMGGASI